MEITKLLILARKNLGASVMDSSARLCFSDAMAQYELGNYTSAKARAVQSLAYSVGILHHDYKRAQA